MAKHWHFINIYPEAKIGKGTRIGSYVEIRNDVKIGKNCVIGPYVFVPEGITIEDNCFIGPKVCFANDKYPPSGGNWSKTLVKKGARIGANATILPGVIIGENSLIGAGAVVVHNVEANSTVIGNPAKELKK